MFSQVNPCKSAQPLLWILHQLDIIDKHRRIIVEVLVHHSVFVREAMRQMLIEQGQGDMAIFAGLLRPAFFTSAKTGRKAKVGDVIFTTPPDTSEEMKKKLKFTCDIAFDEPGIIEVSRY